MTAERPKNVGQLARIRRSSQTASQPYLNWKDGICEVWNRIHCVKWGVSRCWNQTIRTRILREYGHTRTYRVPRHATCPPRVRNRICSDSDLTRAMENPMSGYVIDTRRVETWKFPYTFRFAANNVRYTSRVVSQFAYLFSFLSKKCRLGCSKNSFTRCFCPEIPCGTRRIDLYFKTRFSTVLRESRLVFRNPKFHGTWRKD